LKISTKFLPYVLVVAIFILASIIYFHPVLKGQKIQQSDITQFKGMVKEINDFRAVNNSEPYWTGASFSGMPSYQISAYYPNDLVRVLDQTVRFLPRPADYTFLYFLSFFVLMMALKVNWRLAIFGALSFGFSTYLIIIFGAGHNAKAHAIAYMPLVLAGVLWVFQKRYILGFVITSLAMTLEIYTNHPQMTYYLGFCLLIFGIVSFIDAIKEQKITDFIRHSAIVVVAVLIGIGANSPRLMAMKEYADQSTRGTSELTINPDGSQKVTSNGLDKSYITEYSYSKLETFNLVIPGFMGGGTVEELDDDSQFYKLLEEKAGKKAADQYAKQVLLYWGDQPIVEAPAYIGSVIFFLFFLGIFLVKGRVKQWLVAVTIFSIVMSWGKNFDLLTNFFIDYVPLYNKFRAVSSIQVLAEMCVPILAILGLKEFFLPNISTADKQEALKKALYVFSGLLVLGLLLAYSFSTFEGLRDSQYSQLPGLVDAVIADRKSLLLYDSFRSLFLSLLSAAVLYVFLKNKLKQVGVIVLLVIFMLFDLISINKKYVNEADFKPSRKNEKPFKASEADKIILQDTSHFRVGNFTVNPMNDGSTSYFHQSIGGYHAAKMMRYQELFEYQIAKNNRQVLNMLNTKYYIVDSDKGIKQAQLNPDANGNAWFVERLKVVNSANEAILALDSVNTKNVAVFERSSSTQKELKSSFEMHPTDTIELLNYDVNSLTYLSKTVKEQFAVFSEIYYKNGWNAYIDGELVPHYRINYVLRGMLIPPGEHTIEFKFAPKVIQQGSVISLFSYLLLFGIPIGGLFFGKNK
jgi:hypothetical protein